MTTKEFWKKYTKENILEIFDFFSKELPADFLEEYDVAEVILETKGHHVSAKEFGRVLKFVSLLQEKHPGLYHENFHYLDGFLASEGPGQWPVFNVP